MFHTAAQGDVWGLCHVTGGRFNAELHLVAFLIVTSAVGDVALFLTGQNQTEGRFHQGLTRRQYCAIRATYC